MFNEQFIPFSSNTNAFSMYFTIIFYFTDINLMQKLFKNNSKTLVCYYQYLLTRKFNCYTTTKPFV